MADIVVQHCHQVREQCSCGHTHEEEKGRDQQGESEGGEHNFFLKKKRIRDRGRDGRKVVGRRKR